MKTRKIDYDLRDLILECVVSKNPLSNESYSVILKMLRLAFWYGYRTAQSDIKKNEETLLKWVKK